MYSQMQLRNAMHILQIWSSIYSEHILGINKLQQKPINEILLLFLWMENLGVHTLYDSWQVICNDL